MSDRKIAISGYSGHGYVIAEVAISCGFKLEYYSEKKEVDNNPYHLNYIGFEGEDLFLNNIKDIDFILGIGDNVTRLKVFKYLISKGLNVLNVIHDDSLVSSSVSIGHGNFLSKGVIVNAFTKIGDACILNTGAIIEHECRIGNGVHIAPGAVLAGSVTVGDGAFIGANAVVKQGITIGKNCLIGAGSVVVKNIPENTTGYGNPFKIK